MNVHVISDTHFNQFSIIFFGKRPFSNASSMNDTIIKNWNKKVGTEDVVIVVGDLFMGCAKRANEILSKLNGKLILVEGNHDTKKRLNNLCRLRKLPIMRELKLDIDDFKLLFSHKPSKERFDFNIHGHHHRKLRSPKLTQEKYFNAAVEFNNYGPRLLTEVIKYKSSKFTDFELKKINDEVMKYCWKLFED